MSKFVVQNTVSVEMIRDLGRDRVEGMIEIDGRRQASAAGVVLPEEFSVTRSPMVWVDEWDGGSGAFVSPHHAALALGSTPEPGHELITLAWRVTRPDLNA